MSWFKRNAKGLEIEDERQRLYKAREQFLKIIPEEWSQPDTFVPRDVDHFYVVFYWGGSSPVEDPSKIPEDLQEQWRYYKGLEDEAYLSAGANTDAKKRWLNNFLGSKEIVKLALQKKVIQARR